MLPFLERGYPGQEEQTLATSILSNYYYFYDSKHTPSEKMINTLLNLLPDQ